MVGAEVRPGPSLFPSPNLLPNIVTVIALWQNLAPTLLPNQVPNGSKHFAFQNAGHLKSFSLHCNELLSKDFNLGLKLQFKSQTSLSQLSRNCFYSHYSTLLGGQK